MNTPAKIRVLIADDSTFVRKALVRILDELDDIEVVAEARDGLNAVELARRLVPDVMTLDLQMPNLNGLDVLRVLREELPTRMIMVSSFTREGAEETFLALEEGAFDFVDKTLVSNRKDFVRLGRELAEKIRLAAHRGGAPAGESGSSSTDARANADTAMAQREWSPLPDGLVVVGASTGGPPAVRRFFSVFRPDIRAAFVIIQHMPPGFSAGFANRLNQVSPLVITEMRNGDALTAGHAYVVPSGKEVVLEKKDDKIRATLKEGDSDKRHRPSLDFTLAGAAKLDIPLKMAVVLTGMGSDGQESASEFVKSGGIISVQNEESCIIYGMPKAVKQRVPDVLEGPPEELGRHVIERFSNTRTDVPDTE